VKGRCLRVEGRGIGKLFGVEREGFSSGIKTPPGSPTVIVLFVSFK